MAWPFEEHLEFWSSLDDLDQTQETAAIVNKLVERAITDPRAAPADVNGVRIVKSRSAHFDGKFYPALKLAYTFDLLDPTTHTQPEVVLLVKVRTYDDADETLEGDEEFLRGIS